MKLFNSKPAGRLPDFIVIGASKCGTTSLYHYLSRHPDIHMASPKEPRYFIDRPEPDGRWGRGPAWYASLFKSRKKCCGEASPGYVRDAKQNGVARRMFSVVPKAKLIFMVREPYQRFVSHYKMMYRNITTDCSFPEFIKDDQGAIMMSCYGSCLQEYLNYYPREQILVLESTELRAHREACLSQVLSFLGVDASYRTPQFYREHHVGEESIYPNARGRALLKSKPVKIIQRNMSDWSFYHARNLLMLPFRGPEPAIDLPADVEHEVRSLFRSEVALLRKLTGQALPSLGE